MCRDEAVRRDKTMAPCTSVHSDSSDKDQLPMEPNSEDPKDNNDQEAEVALPISILPRRLLQQELQALMI